MNSRDNETLIVLAGVAVLAVSLILPMVQRIAAEHDVHEVAVRAIEVKDKLLSSTDAAKPLRVRMTEIVDGLSPDVALAEAEMRNDKAVAPASIDAVVSPQEALPVKAAAAAPPEADEAVAETKALEPEQVAPEQVVEARPRAPIAPRDGVGAKPMKRAGAAGIWDQ